MSRDATATQIVREAVEYALLQAEATFDPLIRDGHAEDKAGHRLMVKAGIAGTPSLLTLRLRDALAALSPNAILIDPTTPETVAALAAALRTIPVPTSYEEWQAAIDRTYEADAAAILPAFVARLRGEMP